MKPNFSGISENSRTGLVKAVLLSLSGLMTVLDPHVALGQPSGGQQIQGSGSATKLGQSAAQRLVDEKKLKYFEGEDGQDAIRQHEKDMYEEQLLWRDGGNPNMDEFYRVHMRDLNITGERFRIQELRDIAKQGGIFACLFNAAGGFGGIPGIGGPPGFGGIPGIGGGIPGIGGGIPGIGGGIPGIGGGIPGLGGGIPGLGGGIPGLGGGIPGLGGGIPGLGGGIPGLGGGIPGLGGGIPGLGGGIPGLGGGIPGLGGGIPGLGGGIPGLGGGVPGLGGGIPGLGGGIPGVGNIAGNLPGVGNLPGAGNTIGNGRLPTGGGIPGIGGITGGSGGSGGSKPASGSGGKPGQSANTAPGLGNTGSGVTLKSLVYGLKINKYDGESGAGPYTPQILNSNFRICCVREADRGASTTDIVLKYPNGNGWSSLVEAYYPSAQARWGQERHSMTILKESWNDDIKAVKDMRQGQPGEEYASKAIGRLAAADQKGGITQGDSNAEQKAKNAVKDAQQSLKDAGEDKFFYSDVQNQLGFEVSPLHVAVEKQGIAEIGAEFCLGYNDGQGGEGSVNQFGKLFNPSPQQDPYWKKPGDDKGQGGQGGGAAGGGDRDQLIWNTKSFTSLSPDGAKLLMDMKETEKLKNPYTKEPLFEGEKYTNFPKGMQELEKAKGADVYQRWVTEGANKQHGGYRYDGLEEVAKKLADTGTTFDQSGYTSRGWESRQDMVPVSLNNKTDLDARNPGSAVKAWLHTAGWIDPANAQNGGGGNGPQSRYKNWDNQPHTRWIGAPLTLQQGETNEFGMPCKRAVETKKTLTGKVCGDIAYLPKKFKEFRQDPIESPCEGDGSNGPKTDFNELYMAEWANQNQDVPIRAKNLEGQNQEYKDDEQFNYMARLSMIATCPEGWVPWEPQEADLCLTLAIPAAQVRQACGSTDPQRAEKLW